MAVTDLLSLKVYEFTYVVTLCVVVYSLFVYSLWLYLGSVSILYICLKAIRRKSTGRITIKGQGVFITGCDTGFGHDLARRLDELGFTVFAGCLHPEGEGAGKLKAAASKKLHIVPLDVGSDTKVKEALEYVVKHLPKQGLWGIVNNAGFNVMGDVEWCTIGLYHKAMNVNFYGAVRTLNNFLYLVRKNKGRVAIVTSCKGRTSWPADSAYHVTKHALETMSDSLRMEMIKFGVQVSIIEPGNFSTVTACQNKDHFVRYREEADEMWEAAGDDTRRTYGREYLDNMIRKQEESIGGGASSTKPVIDALEDALVSERPHTRYLIDGTDGWIDIHTTLARYYDYMPTWLSDWIITRLTDTSCDLPTTYSPQYVEAAWYDWWTQQGFFSPEYKQRILSTEQDKTFVMCLPPPNVTGTLHLGHALTCSIQDALVRWHRMNGYQTVWVPGCDHAGIATQVVVEKQLWKDTKQTRHDLGREAFLQRVWEWKNRIIYWCIFSKGNTIYEQMKRMGSSLDWDRAVFTMDENMSRAVVEAFVRLHEDGQIYRSNRLVNWSCQLKSAISDIEVENGSIDGPTKLPVPGYNKPQVFGEMASFQYPVINSDECITVSTTRLETMLGDTAVAVHPDDPRYTHLHGSFLEHPLDGRHIPVICDTYVDREFGTGAVKITPAHDPNDYTIGDRHGLAFINVINDSGEMENVPDQFEGMKRFDARQKVEQVLTEKGLFQGKSPHAMVLPICSRSRDIIEPRIKAQWYVDCKDMAEHAVQAVESGDLSFTPDFYRKTWFDFLRDSEDWCISRQIWWGHRIPAYRVVGLTQESGSTDEVWVSGRTEEEAYNKVEQQLGLQRDSFQLEQDEDVLDTWFSSALFPFSVHGWPEETTDLKQYYPCSLMETGSDIIFFWVARMVMMGYKMTGQLPFSKVLLHGILRDAQGRKMSKSLGNVIDPMDVVHGVSLQDLHRQVEAGNLDPREVDRAKKGQTQDFPQGIPECGSDALRFALCSYNFKDAEINMNILHVQNYRHFCNKIWQAFKFASEKMGSDFKPASDIQSISPCSKIDSWILSRLSHTVQLCETHMETYDLQIVTKALYSFWVADFCDIYLEYAKKVFQTGDSAHVNICQDILHMCIDTFLRAVSPFMPFISEELYQRLPSRGGNRAPSVCVAEYPASTQYPWYASNLDNEMAFVRNVCTSILSVVQGYNLPRKSVQVYVKSDVETSKMLSSYIDIFNILTKVHSVSMVTEMNSIPTGCVPKAVRPGLETYIKVQSMINFDIEIARLEKKVATLTKKIQALEKRKCKSKANLSNNSAAHGVQDKITSLESEISHLQQSIGLLRELQTDAS